MFEVNSLFLLISLLTIDGPVFLDCHFLHVSMQGSNHFRMCIDVQGSCYLIGRRNKLIYSRYPQFPLFLYNVYIFLNL